MSDGGGRPRSWRPPARAAPPTGIGSQLHAARNRLPVSLSQCVVSLPCSGQCQWLRQCLCLYVPLSVCVTQLWPCQSVSVSTAVLSHRLRPLAALRSVQDGHLLNWIGWNGFFRGLGWGQPLRCTLTRIPESVRSVGGWRAGAR